MRAGAAGVHHALRDPLVVEVHDLLAQVEVLQQDRARAGPALSEWSVSGMRTPFGVVSMSPACARGSRPSFGPS